MRRWVIFTLACIFIAVPMPAYAMQIFIKTIEGSTITLDAEPGDSIEGLKAKISDFYGIPSNEQFMYFGEVLLEDGNSLAYYNIRKEAVIFLRQNPSIAAARAKAQADADAAAAAAKAQQDHDTALALGTLALAIGTVESGLVPLTLAATKKIGAAPTKLIKKSKKKKKK
jgi:hypothetical protein